MPDISADRPNDVYCLAKPQGWFLWQTATGQFATGTLGVVCHIRDIPTSAIGC